MVAINFQPQFAAAVESGQKTQTVRKANRFKIGDNVTLYTRQRTKLCRKLGEGVITCVDPIGLYTLYGGQIYVSGKLLSLRQSDLLAIEDGFSDTHEMFAWFKDQHGLPFEGWLIKWKLFP